jgi:ubiquinol-cytochrome c reductase cytochrome b subunit
MFLNNRYISNLQMTKKFNLEKWNEWLAGVVDGDGCFAIAKKTDNLTISFELTAHTSDARIPKEIYEQLKTGSVGPRSGSNSVRFRAKSQNAIKNLVERLNGKLYNPRRLEQFSRMCQIVNMQQVESPALISPESSYLAGLINADGTFCHA